MVGALIVTNMREKRAALESLITAENIQRMSPPMLLPAAPYFDLAGEEFGRRLLLSLGTDGVEYCLRPEFTIPLAQAYLEGTQGPAALSYLGQVFRQREEGPAEFEQAGLELLAQPDANAALDQVLKFAVDALAIYGVNTTLVHLGSVAMFEALLAAVDIPDVWRPRIRHRFGHPESITPLLQRLADPHGTSDNIDLPERAVLIEEISGRMVEAGLSLTSGRTAEEIADRWIEKQALAAASIPAETIDVLTKYLAISGPVEEALDQVDTLIKNPSDKFLASAKVVRSHAATLAQRVPSAKINFAAGFSPRLDYYTGVVFEITTAKGDILASGGQYSRLLQRLGAKDKVQASGCSVWVGRLEQEVSA